MKTRIKLLSTGTIAVLSCSLAFAQQQSPQQPQDQQQSQAEQQRQQQEFGQQTQQQAQQQQAQLSEYQPHRASDLEGSRVVNPNGDRLGTVEDLAFNMEEGSLPFAIIAAGGFLGIGSDWKPVPPEILQIRPVDTGLEVVIDMTEEEWNRAPTIGRDQVDHLTHESRAQEIYQFFNADWQAAQERQTTYGARSGGEQQPQQQSGVQAQQIEQQLQQAMTQAGVEQQQAQQEAQRVAQQASQGQQTEQQLQQQIEQAFTRAGVEQERAQQEADQLSSQIHQQIEFGAPPEQRQQPESTLDQTAQESQQMAQDVEQQMQQSEAEPTSRLHLASDLRRKPIVNQQGEEIGEISDFIISASQGRLAFVLFSEGTGIFQPSDQEYAASPAAFQNITEHQAQLNVNQQDLEQAQMLTLQQLPSQAQQLAQRGQQAQQQPQVFRYAETDGSPGVFGAPDRERQSREGREVRQLEEQSEPGLQQPQRTPPTIQQQPEPEVNR